MLSKQHTERSTRLMIYLIQKLDEMIRMFSSVLWRNQHDWQQARVQHWWSIFCRLLGIWQLLVQQLVFYMKLPVEEDLKKIILDRFRSFLKEWKKSNISLIFATYDWLWYDVLWVDLKKYRWKKGYIGEYWWEIKRLR